MPRVWVVEPSYRVGGVIEPDPVITLSEVARLKMLGDDMGLTRAKVAMIRPSGEVVLVSPDVARDRLAKGWLEWVEPKLLAEDVDDVLEERALSHIEAEKPQFRTNWGRALGER